MNEPGTRMGGVCPACNAEVASGRCESCGAATEVGGYRALRVLAQGQSGRTYLAVDSEGEKVTLKELVLLETPGHRWMEWFERQAGVLARLSHPRLPRWLGCFEDGEGIHRRLYLAAEYVEGESLLERLDSHRYNEDEALAIGRKVLSILLYLHRQRPRLIHRDIKPANLIVDDAGAIHLVDFGSVFELPGASAKGRTQTGTIGYAPVEQLGGAVDEWCDLHALGATLMHLLTRTPPWELTRDGRLDTGTRKLDVSPRTRVFLGRLLAAEESERVTTAVDALRLLDELEGKGPRRAVSSMLWAGGLATLLVLAVSAAVLRSGAEIEETHPEVVHFEPEAPLSSEPRPPPGPPPLPEPPPPVAKPGAASPEPEEPPEPAIELEASEFEIDASVSLASVHHRDLRFAAGLVRVVPRPSQQAFPRTDVIIEGRCEVLGEAKQCPPNDWVVLHDENWMGLPRGISFTNRSTDTHLSTSVPLGVTRVLLTFGLPAHPDGRWLLDLEQRELVSSSR